MYCAVEADVTQTAGECVEEGAGEVGIRLILQHAACDAPLIACDAPWGPCLPFVLASIVLDRSREEALRVVRLHGPFT